MKSRWFNIAVVVLWASSMSWLVVAKILPSFAVGDPPNRYAILSAQTKEQRVGYEVRWNEAPVGTALVCGERLAGGGTLTTGRVQFDRLPVRDMIPQGIVKLVGLDEAVPDHIQFDAQHQVLFHANGRLQRFDSTISLGPQISKILVEGFVAGDTVVLTIRSAGVTYATRRPLPRNVMVSNGLMPQSRMPGLREGQKWTIEVYSPLRPPTDPMEILQAEVVGRDLISWGGGLENAWLVVYRGDPGAKVGRSGKESVWLWVRDDGVVLQHRMAVFDGTLTFVRLPSGKELELERRLSAEQPTNAQAVEKGAEAEQP